MIELLFTVCLVSDPTSCETKGLLFYEITETACTLRAQPELAHWSGEHPGWHIERWTCHALDGAHAA